MNRRENPITLDELKSVNYKLDEAPVYKVLRRISIRFSYYCIKWNISPNLITFFSFLSAMISAILLTIGSTQTSIIASLTLIISYILDCMDGEIARGERKTSLLGTQMELILHWLIIGIMQAGVTIGVYNLFTTPFLLLFGFMSIIGWYSFYFLYVQLMMWVDRSAEFSILRKWSKYLFKVMPIDQNLLIVFSLTDNVGMYLIFSGILSIGLFCTTFGIFLYYQSKNDNTIS